MKEKIKLDMVITHDGTQWIVWDDSMRIAARTLEELDSGVRERVREQGLVPRDGCVEVFMAFDNSAIPSWMRPFSNHYFNRIVEVRGQ